METTSNVVNIGRGNRAGNPGAHAAAAKVNGKAANKDGIRRGTNRDGSEWAEAQVRVKGFQWNGKKQLSKRFKGPGAFKEALAWKLAEEKAARAVLAAGPQLAVEGMLLSVPVADALQAFIDLRTNHTNAQLAHHEVLQYLRFKKHPLLKGLRVNELTQKAVVAYFRDRGVRQGCAPSTCLKEFVYLRKATRELAREHRATWGFFDPCNEDVRKQLVDEELIAESHEKIRIAEEHELQQLRGYFADDAAMLAAIEVANVNAFRRGEVERASWAGFNELGNTLTIDRKDSKSKGGRRQCWVPLLAETVAIIKAQPRVEGEDRIFPTYSGETISAKFNRACRELGINKPGQDDETVLTFHDLRHTALTRLAQNMAAYGIGIPELKLISGHKATKHLDRYLNFKDRHAAEVARKLGGFRAIPVVQPTATVTSIAA